jgi:hypothetical protein
MSVRGDLRPVRRISPALRQNFIRSSRNHQLEPGVARKNLSPERTRLTLFPPLTQVRVAEVNEATNRSGYLFVVPARIAPPAHQAVPAGSGPQALARRLRNDKTPGARVSASGGRGSDRMATMPGVGLRLTPGPLRGPGPGSVRCAYCALRSSSASSDSTSTKSVSSPAGTIA